MELKDSIHKCKKNYRTSKNKLNKTQAILIRRKQYLKKSQNEWNGKIYHVHKRNDSML